MNVKDFQRFAKHVQIPVDGQGCWEWVGARAANGYGTFGYKPTRHTRYAHRVIFEHYKGPLEGYHCCHHCDNRSCVNPEHLFKGTQQDNMTDAAMKGRMPRGSQSPRAIFTEDKVLWIRSQVASGRMQKDVAKELGASKMAISQIITRKHWKHI